MSWAVTPTLKGELIDGSLNQICEYDLEEKHLDQGRYLIHHVFKLKEGKKFGVSP